jgi:hypothetical protein
VSVEVSVVSAMPASGARSRSKRLTSSAAKCCESAAEPPLPQASALPPALSDCASSAPAFATGSPSTAAAVSLRFALSAKCAATRPTRPASACCMRRGFYTGRLGMPVAVLSHAMATKLDKTLKREITIDGKPFVVSISPERLKLVGKGRRKGLELSWEDLTSGDAALATALNASVAQRLVLEPSASKHPGRRRGARRKRSTSATRDSAG